MLSHVFQKEWEFLAAESPPYDKQQFYASGAPSHCGHATSTCCPRCISLT